MASTGVTEGHNEVHLERAAKTDNCHRKDVPLPDQRSIAEAMFAGAARRPIPSPSSSAAVSL